VSLRIAPPIREALRAGRPVVALESTVVTHGLPRPRNLALARRLEEVVREEGAVPATVAVLDGEVVVGAGDAALERLANDDHADKASLWNLAALVAAGRNAGTTVATTLYAAHAAGIQVFATGGIGGVHDHPFDESADLRALARFPLLTVCAGPKSILDASATLERLESLGVPVVGYRSDRLAGFVVPQADLPVPSRVESPAEAARLLRAQSDLGLRAGVVLSNPVTDGIAPERFAAWLERARADLDERGLRGRDATPFLLARLAELSDGATVEVNLRLLEANARLAARVAAGLGEHERGSSRSETEGVA
jgi:pseudouridylate synthase